MNNEHSVIFNWLQDDESRAIWSEYSDFCGSRTKWQEVLLHDCIDKLKNSQFAIYGIGERGVYALDYLKRKNLLNNCIGIWDADPSKHGNKLEGITVTPPPDTEVNRIDSVLITPIAPHMVNQMIDKCRELGIGYYIAGNSYDRFLDKYRTNWIKRHNAGYRQYLDPYIIIPRLVDNEVFIDGGSFNFNSSKEFIECISANKRTAKKIYAFEASPENVKLVKTGILAYPHVNIQLEISALWDCAGELSFRIDTANGYGSYVTENSDTTTVRIPAVTIDETVPDSENVTYVKLDVEGAELRALIGAKNTILRCKPKLAISLYHNPNDYILLPEYIHSLVPEYKAYIRHEQADQCETDRKSVV